MIKKTWGTITRVEVFIEVAISERRNNLTNIDKNVEIGYIVVMCLVFDPLLSL